MSRSCSGRQRNVPNSMIDVQRCCFAHDVHVAIDVEVQSGDISILHFQYGGVCLHFTRASFNTVFGKSNFKITLKYLVRRPFI